jgi:RHS repeat-associated protein
VPLCFRHKAIVLQSLPSIIATLLGFLTGMLSPTFATLGTYSYQFDAIGRRKNHTVSANWNDLLNQTKDWKNSQNKTVKLSAHPDARVWFNGVEIQNFNGNHSYAITPPGTQGGWVPWNTLAVLEGQGDPGAHPDAKAEKSGAVWVPPVSEQCARIGSILDGGEAVARRVSLAMHGEVNQSFTYDAAGNRESSAQWNYGWDAKNQLARARTKNHNTAAQGYDITNAYDTEGRRFSKKVKRYQNGQAIEEKIITYLHDGNDLIYERHQHPSGYTILERKYVWGPDIADGSAGGAGGLLLIRETKSNVTTDLYPLYDGTGHIIALTDSNGTLQAEYAYGPFGETIYARGPKASSCPFRYATKYYDEETVLYNFGRRFLDPVTGQFLSREPLGESESINLYSYCQNDPVNNVDVLGLKKFPILNPTNPFVMKDGAWHRNEIFVHAADWFWQTSQGILPGTERIGRKAGPLDFAGWQLDGDTWRPTAANAGLAKAFADKGWDLDSQAELTGVAGGAMTTLVAAPMAIASTITAAPALYTAGYVKATGASVAIQSSPWGVPILGGALTSGAMLLDGEDPGTAIASGGMQALTGRAMSAPLNWSAMRPANWGVFNPAHYRMPLGQLNTGIPIPQYVGPTRPPAGQFTVGIYDDIRGTVPGLDAHHVGQKAVMGRLIPGYDPATAPAILVPKLGHTRVGPTGRLSTVTEGFTNPRDVIARDIWEMRRVYPEVPNTQLQLLIEMNKIMYPSVNK